MTTEQVRRKIRQILSWCAISLALAGIGVLIVATWQHSSKPATRPEQVRIIDVMHALEIRLEELYGAVLHEDWKKAEFALERLERTAGQLYGRQIYWQQLNIGQMAEALLQQQSAGLRQFIATRDQVGFVRKGRDLIASCNACHHATGQIVFVQEPPMAYGIQLAETQ